MSDGPRSILIVDDTPEDRFRHRWLLSRTSFRPLEIQQAETGASGLRLAETMLPDCILLDYSLPDMTATEFLQELRAREALRDTSVVTITGHADPEHAVNCIKQGAHEHLIKGNLNPSELARAITSAMRQARLNQCLRTKQAELERFAHTVAHDLRAPLNRIATMTELLLENHDPEAARDLCGRIFQNTRRLRTLVDDLLQYAQTVQGSVPREALPLGQVVEASLCNLEEEVLKSGARISVSELPVVRGNETLLVQLFQNLIGNAIKFRPPGRAPEVQVYSEARDGSVAVVVSDNGIGIDPAHHAEVFAPLKRLHSNHRYEGNGIGLATCLRAVQQHDGKIWVESNEGEGAKFYVVLPDATLSLPDGVRADPIRRVSRAIQRNDPGADALERAA